MTMLATAALAPTYTATAPPCRKAHVAIDKPTLTDEYPQKPKMRSLRSSGSSFSVPLSLGVARPSVADVVVMPDTPTTRVIPLPLSASGWPPGCPDGEGPRGRIRLFRAIRGVRVAARAPCGKTGRTRTNLQ